MTTAHAILAPSAAARWVICAGSVKLSQQYPEPEDSIAAREGTAAHWGAAEVLLGRTIDVGQIAENGVMLDEDMLDAIDIYTEDALAVKARTGGFIIVETRVLIPTVHADNWGTPDSWLFDKKSGVLYIWDFKYGHRYVDAFENWQLIDYVAGIAEVIGMDGIKDQNTRVVMTVVQPRNYSPEGPVRRWEAKMSDLRGHINALRMAAERALAPDPLCTPNPHCDYCPARGACKALEVAAMSALDLSTASVPVDLPPAALGLELTLINRALEYLEARKTGLEEQAMSVIKAGNLVPRFTAKPTEGRLTWAKPIEEVIALGGMMNIPLEKKAALTPRQAIKSGLPEELVNAYAAREKGALKLVADDGKSASKIFG